MTQSLPPLAQGLLDRDGLARLDEAKIRAAWAEPAARVLRLRGAEIPVTQADSVTNTGAAASAARLVLLPAEGAWQPEHAAGPAGTVGLVYLGRMAGAPVFARAAEADEPAGEIGHPAEWQPIFKAAIDLPADERELVAAASAVLRWHESSLFSGISGEATTPINGGWARVDAEGREYFPRTDPAVIVLIEHAGRVLLGSNALWEDGRFSLLAGFVDAGESIEQAVRREMLEEAGLKIGDVKYIASQPWPFPRSLMLGFHAHLAEGVAPEDAVADPDEISELRWFTRDELLNPPPGITLPGALSIARWLIDDWCAAQ